ncbi:MAG: hypothetical protein RIC35_08700 [Marinoscillum sp.]
MKLTILSIILTFFLVTPSIAQVKAPNNAQYEAGVALKKFSKQYFAGVGVMAGGYAITILSLSNGGDDRSAALLGSVAVLAGGVLTIISHANIGKAGEQLMISSQQIGFSNQRVNNIGWAFNIGGKRKSRRLKLLAGN